MNKEVEERYYRENIEIETLYKEEENTTSSSLFRGTKVKRFENDVDKLILKNILTEVTFCDKYTKIQFVYKFIETEPEK